MVAHQAIGNHPAVGEFLLQAHQRPEFLLLLRAESKTSVHDAGNHVVKYRFPGRFPPLGQPARLSHGEELLGQGRDGKKRLRLKACPSVVRLKACPSVVSVVSVAVETLRTIGSPHWRNQLSSAGWSSTPPVPSGMARGSAGASSGWMVPSSWAKADAAKANTAARAADWVKIRKVLGWVMVGLG